MANRTPELELTSWKCKITTAIQFFFAYKNTKDVNIGAKTREGFNGLQLTFLIL